MYLSYTIWYHLLNSFHLVVVLVRYMECYITWIFKDRYVYVPTGNLGASRDPDGGGTESANPWLTSSPVWTRGLKRDDSRVKDGTCVG
jgi:hypothetical protein